MSDRYSRMFASYAAGTAWPQLPDETVHEVKRRILDSIGTATAAFDDDSPRAARRYASAFPDPNGAIVWGTGLRANPEIAGFANAVAVRYLDFNDTYLSLEPLHPSDAIPALVALAEVRNASPKDLIAAIAISYELSVTLCDAASLRAHGWDHVNYIALGVAAGAGRLLDLSGPQIEAAIAIATVPHASMRQTRAGELSMWKGAAAANSARNATFAVLLAEAGMTGPFEPFAGEMGLFRQLLQGEAFDDGPLAGIDAGEPPRRISDTYVKRWPVEYHAQSAVDAALALRLDLGGDPGRIDRIRIDTFRASYEIIAKDPQKWDPQTRETADHSLQYIVVAALQDGALTPETFDLARIRRPDTLAILRERVTLEQDPILTAAYPEGIPNRITVTTTEGETLVREVTYPRGHSSDPMSDEEVGAKYRLNVGERWEAGRANLVAEHVWNLERSATLEHLTTALRAEEVASEA